MVTIARLELTDPGLAGLQAEAKAEGYEYLDRLVEDWANGSTTFAGPGEILRGCWEDGELIAVGGLTRDPFAGQGEVGRIRRMYVRAGWRNRGVGRRLVERLIEDARKGFTSVRLAAENGDAARLYERLGFVAIEDKNASHVLLLDASYLANASGIH